MEFIFFYPYVTIFSELNQQRETDRKLTMHLHFLWGKETVEQKQQFFIRQY